MKKSELIKFKIAELREMAENNGVLLDPKDRKGDIIEKLLNADLDNKAGAAEESNVDNVTMDHKEDKYESEDNIKTGSEEVLVDEADEIVADVDSVNAVSTEDNSDGEKAESNKFEATGIIDINENGFGFLRFDNFLTSEEDIYVPQSQVKRFRLKTGDKIKGICIEPRNNERYGSLIYVLEVNGDEPYKIYNRKEFKKLTPTFPNRRIVLEKDRDVSLRLIDLVAPIGFGQRGLIVAQPKAGKTVLLKKVATSIEEKYPDAEMIVLLIDERPEEVTDMKRTLKGRGEVIYSTFDERPEHHIKVAEMVLERAQRLAEQGKDAVILMDSITRLARAYNLVEPSSGKILSGGLDPSSLYYPKKFFGAARNLEEGGSVTIIATALVETGSRMDDVIFEEFKGTGNMELHLDRKMAEKRIYPAIDVLKSGTRKENILLDEEELEVSWGIRKFVSNGYVYDTFSQIIKEIKDSKDNKIFIERFKAILKDEK